MTTPTMALSLAVATSKRDINMGLGRRTASAFTQTLQGTRLIFMKRGGERRGKVWNP